jgi:hypothetical protein
LGFFASILLNQPTKTKIGSETPSTTLRTSLSQPEPIANIGSFQNVPPDDNNCPLTRVVHFEVPIDKTNKPVYLQALNCSSFEE